MSFFEDNKFYIQQNLYTTGMAHLSVEDRLTKYESIRTEMRTRIFKSHPKNKVDLSEVTTIELVSFYKELFEGLGEFEVEYLIANLFFEPNFSNIVYYLSKNSKAFNDLISPPFREYTFKYFLSLYLKENDFYRFVFIKFLKEFICSHTTLSTRHLEIQTIRNTDVFEFVHEYPKWLIDDLTKQPNVDQTIFIHLLVVKLLNLEPTFIEHEKGSTFSILLLSELSKAYNLKINSGVSPKLHSFYTKTNKLIETYFTKHLITRTPLFENEERLNYTRGVHIKREQFLKQVEEAEILNNDMRNESYSYLFIMFIQSSGLIQEKIKNDILNKIKVFELPTKQDFKDLHENNTPKELEYLKKWILSKFYLFEIQNKTVIP